MSNKPRITAIATVLNKEAWVGETILTLKQQSLKDWEAIYVNDGSTDSTGTVLDYLASEDSRIKVVHFTENKGCSVALNFATSLATSDIIAVCSGDDVYHENRLERAVKFFKKHKDVEVYYESYIIGHPDLTQQGKHIVVPFDLEDYLRILPNGRANQTVCHWFCAYRKTVGDKVKYDETRKVGIDYPFFADVAKAGFKFAHNPNESEIGGIYRILPKSVTQTQGAEINAEDREYVEA